ncbi:hypothetical protein ACJRO7_021735 [Eucalyptus globulus]|uniref:Pentatricopeptide repeat-containing protein n=1 Tax=Eucalyptus globulus TaxID=34317 RepID=A0ABD3KTC6_EUCGL
MKARVNLRADCRRLGFLPLFNPRPLLFGDSRALATANPPSLELDGVQRRRRHSAPVSCSRTETVAGTFHATAIKKGSVQNASVGNYVLALFAKARKSGDARKLFGVLPVQDVRGWTIHLSSFARDGSRSSPVIREAEPCWICRDSSSLASGEAQSRPTLASSSLASRRRDQAMPDLARLELAGIGRGLISPDLARPRPRSTPASSSLTRSSEARRRQAQASLDASDLQGSSKGEPWRRVAEAVSALGLASSLSLLDVGRQVHGIVIRLGINSNEFTRTSLIDMYCKCGETQKASINSEIAYTDAYACSSLVSGYVKNGNYENAFEVFNTMVQKCMKVDKFTITSIISASANVGILELGRKIHAYILKVGYYLDVHLSSSLIDMYSKCGSLDDALSVFKQSQDSNVVLWTSLIFGFALHARGKEAVRLVECMINEGIIPNEITIVGILTAYSHAGLLEEGREYFRLMKDVYGIKPGKEHYACMVDLYGRSGLSNEPAKHLMGNS